jgi:hypothetical protein
MLRCFLKLQSKIQNVNELSVREKCSEADAVAALFNGSEHEQKFAFRPSLPPSTPIKNANPPSTTAFSPTSGKYKKAIKHPAGTIENEIILSSLLPVWDLVVVICAA